MRAFYVNKYFGPAKSSGFIDEEEDICEYVFKHTNTDAAGLHFRVYSLIEDTCGCELTSQFIYPGKRSTRAGVIEFYRTNLNNGHIVVPCSRGGDQYAIERVNYNLNKIERVRIKWNSIRELI